ncbi:MAG TPA: CusA/CzcA family heavy metal efflux RND transporter [Xanthobacteraceae bacterium]|nr:CusA/CzcA family heavy metal efflux RND transporter [Xanthobacteraceae bacterium]
MNAIIALSLKHRALVVILFVLTLGGGIAAFRALNIEAYPDPVPPLVNIITQSPGLSAEEVERYITIPIETQIAGLPNTRVLRTLSLYGLSDIKLQFNYEYSYEQALQQVLNRLSQISGLPNGAEPQISPVSPIGEIYRYRLRGPAGYSVLDLKTLQDWTLQRRFRAVPGVVDVIGWGGKTKTFELQVDLNKLVAYGLTLPQLIQSVTSSNVNVGGNTITMGAQSAVVRGVGLIRSIEDLGSTMLTQVGGNPVLVRDVATVVVGHAPRLGVAGMNADDDIVQGIVLMRRGQQSSPTIQRVKEEVERINASGLLPPGVKIERIYDRQELINVTTHTVLHNMVVGILLIVLLQWLFLGDFRSALIVSATIPFALFFAVGLMVLRGESANLLSVGAIDFGLIVDATVIMVERIFRQLSAAPGAAVPHAMAEGRQGLKGKMLSIFVAGAAVQRSILFAAAIIIAGFLPLFTLSGVEGHIFGPMAKTYAYALVGGLVATFTIAPVLSAFLLPDQIRETETWLVRMLHRLYRPILHFSVGNRVVVVAGVAVLLGLTGVGIRSLGTEFMPKLEEGNLWVRATMPSTISLEEGNGYANRMRQLIGSFPEVESVVSQHGRPDDGTDAAGFFNVELFAPLKPADQWRKGLDKDALTNEMQAALERDFPGVEFNFSQYLQDNVAEQVSGVKGENSIKVFGSDLNVLTETAERIKAVLATVPGVTDLSVFTSLGQPTIQIDVDRARAARHGLSPGDINAALRIAIGGEAAGAIYEPGSDRHFPIMVRLAPQFRQDAEVISNMPIAVQGPDGVTQIPLREVADIRLVSGASYIYREQQERYLPIKFSVRERDLGSAIKEAQQKIAQEVQLPVGSRLEWVGEFQNMKDAIGRLQIVVPLSLALIGFLLWLNFSSLSDTLMAMSVIPMAIVGGVFSLLLMQMPFSISAAIGFIALFGISVMNAILIISQFNRLIDRGVERTRAVLEASELQMRPVLMTCVIAGAGLVPAALSTGIGSQVQKPLAVVVVGGMMLAPFIILVALPAMLSLFSRHVSAAEDVEAVLEPAE